MSRKSVEKASNDGDYYSLADLSKVGKMGGSGMKAFPCILLSLFLVLIPHGSEAQDVSAAAPALDAEKAAYISRHQDKHKLAELERIFVSVREMDLFALPDCIARLEAMGEDELLMILLESGEPYQQGSAVEAVGRIASEPNLGRLLQCLDRMSLEASRMKIGNLERAASVARNQHSLLDAIERISGLKYEQPDEMNRFESRGQAHEFPQGIDRDRILAYIEQVRPVERRSDKRPERRPASEGRDETAATKRESSIRRPATGEDGNARKNPDERSWLEVIGGGVLVGMLGYWFLLRPYEKKRKQTSR
ncbi:MAG: hypothetical protein EOP88_27345 [Verrucomicrobiaceae bacterium]|nr:MAG: hypothetical protein EOP88_27345 [Verrucomicrobiaceae bacterium]